jgi:hypothetical protein
MHQESTIGNVIINNVIHLNGRFHYGVPLPTLAALTQLYPNMTLEQWTLHLNRLCASMLNNNTFSDMFYFDVHHRRGLHLVVDPANEAEWDEQGQWVRYKTLDNVRLTQFIF